MLRSFLRIILVTLSLTVMGLTSTAYATEIKCKIKGVGIRNFKLEGFFIQKVYVRKNNKAWAEWCPTNDEQTFKMGKKEAFCQVAAFKHRNMLIWGDTVVNFIEPSWKMRYRYAKPGQTYADSQPNGLERGTCEFWER